MNRGLWGELQYAFPDVIPAERPLVLYPKITNPHWLAGFTSAEGCFMVKIKASKTITVYAVHLEFKLTQHYQDEVLMKSFKIYFDCGRIYKYRDTFNFKVTKLKDITNKIIPLKKKHPILGVKALDFADFCKVAKMIKENKHLTKEGLEQIRKIKARMNTVKKFY